MHGILRLILQSANFFLLSLIVQHMYIVSPIYCNNTYCNTIAFHVTYTTSCHCITKTTTTITFW